MKFKSLFLPTLFLVSWVSGTDILQAQTAALPDLEAARVGFAAAIASKDLRRVLKLTNFPLQNEEESGPKWISRSAFPKYFELHAYPEFSECIKSAPLERDRQAKSVHSSAINCNGNIFYFSEVKGRWLHVKYENINGTYI
jgi:hypothetical protein